MATPGTARGIAFALGTAGLWAILPILMKIALREFPAGNIVWFRFSFAFLALLLILHFKRQSPVSVLRRPPWTGILAGLCLAANYFYFLHGVGESSPSSAGILMQVAPVLVVIIGVMRFGERFTGGQAAGLILALVGFLIFYRDQSTRVADAEQYSTAYFYLLLAAVTWALYMTIQKQLSGTIPAQHLNLVVYGTAAVVLVVTVQWPRFEGHSGYAWGLMAFLGMNTLLAYGFLAEAVKYIPLSLISVIIALNPFITLGIMQVLPLWIPQWLEPEVIGPVGFAGAALAVSGVAVVIHQQGRRPG